MINFKTRFPRKRKTCRRKNLHVEYHHIVPRCSGASCTKSKLKDSFEKLRSCSKRKKKRKRNLGSYSQVTREYFPATSKFPELRHDRRKSRLVYFDVCASDNARRFRSLIPAGVEKSSVKREICRIHRFVTTQLPVEGN